MYFTQSIPPAILLPLPEDVEASESSMRRLLAARYRKMQYLMIKYSIVISSAAQWAPLVCNSLIVSQQLIIQCIDALK